MKSPSSIPLWARFIATGAFSGYVPWASGTVGTLVGVAFYLIPGCEHPLILGSLIVAGFVAGVGSSRIVAAATGNRLTRTAEIAKQTFQREDPSHPDPSIVVIDEIVGMWIALIFLPKTLTAILIAFIAFRAFDVIKPFPAARLEQLPGGWGIMVDDVVAGVYANICTHGALLILTSLAG